MHDSGLEVQVWIRCESTEDLWALAQVLDDPHDGSERIPPPEGRRNMVMTWTALPTEDDAEPWQDAFLYGFDQASYVTDRAKDHCIDCCVYAVRVQPLDAEFEPLIPATTGEDSQRRSEVPASANFRPSEEDA